MHQKSAVAIKTPDATPVVLPRESHRNLMGMAHTADTKKIA